MIPGLSLVADSWERLFKDILEKDRERKAKAPTVILLGVETLWHRELQQVGHPCKPRIKGLLQWLNGLNLSVGQ